MRLEKKWFTRKLYSYGWTPASWQGWLALLVFIGFNVWNFLRIDSHSHSVSDTLTNFVPVFFVTTFLLILLCITKGEPARWQWGKRLED